MKGNAIKKINKVKHKIRKIDAKGEKRKNRNKKEKSIYICINIHIKKYVYKKCIKKLENGK